MHVNISTRHGQLADETQQKISQRLNRLARFNTRLASVHVTVDLAHNDSPDVEVIAHVEKASSFVARTKASGGNLMGAVDAAAHKIEEQLKRYKEKRIDQHRVPVSRDIVNAPVEGGSEDADLE